MVKFFYNQKPATPGSWLADYNGSEFDSPTRSTVPLLDALRREPPAAFLRDLLEASGLDVEASDLHLEFQVKPGKGRGTASHTDLMAIDATRSLAIEAKWTEGRYDLVGKWLGKGKSPENRRQVLRGWLNRIEPHAADPLATDEFDDLVYQMVHRAASAAAACGDNGRPAMAYLMFRAEGFPSHLDKYRADLQRLRSAIGNAESFPFFLVSVSIQPTRAFREVADLKKGKPETGRIVRRSLAQGTPPLFDFAKPDIETI